LGANILLGTLFSNISIICSSLNNRHQILCPCKMTGKSILLYFLIFTILDSRREDKSLWNERQQALSEFNLLLIPLWLSFFICYFPSKIF
jgi:hypothetical protein